MKKKSEVTGIKEKWIFSAGVWRKKGSNVVESKKNFVGLFDLFM